MPANFNLFLFGDDHEGTLLRHDTGWHKLCDMMNSEYEGVSANFGVHHGDHLEAILVDDYRFDNRIGSRSEAIRRLIKEALKKYDKQPEE